MNKVMLIGNLTRDPELNTTNSGVSVCRFSLAVPRRFANADNGPQADFFNIVVWRGQADNCKKYLSKGSKCCVVGRIQTRSYDNDEGEKRYVTEVVADEVEFLGTKKQDGDNDKPELTPVDDDGLPF